MHVRLLSDLHFELHDDLPTFVKGLDLWEDVCVLAGDICNLEHLPGMRALFDAHTGVEFLWVPGNHEYYGSSIPTVDMALEAIEMKCPNFTLLKRRVKEIEGHRFVGATLWYPPTDVSAFIGWSDRHWIHRPFRVFYEAGMDTQFLQDHVTADSVVVTHMLPHEVCVVDRYRGDPSNIFFVHDHAPVIAEHQPKLWMYGHTHTATDVTVDGTRFLCNPRGAPHEAGRTGFDVYKNVDLTAVKRQA